MNFFFALALVRAGQSYLSRSHVKNGCKEAVERRTTIQGALKATRGSQAQVNVAVKDFSNQEACCATRARRRDEV